MRITKRKTAKLKDCREIGDWIEGKRENLPVGHGVGEGEILGTL